MAPRKTSASSSGVEERKDVLTAVVLADSFNQRFRPVTVDQAKVTVPLANHAMLDYTLEWLATSGVKETWVFCCAHANQVKRHLADNGWIREGGEGDKAADDGTMKVRTIVSTNCLSIGEALRRVDQEDIIKTDFVLVSGDCVANMDLKRAVEAHKARREKNKQAIMTLVLRKAASVFARERLGEQLQVVVMDGQTKRLLGWENGDVDKRRSNNVSIEAHIFSERDDVQIRCDLLDCNIYICAPEVLMLFSDNFDYQNIRRDFVSGVLSEEELGNQLFLHILEGREYAAWVSGMRSYDSVTTDVLQRWSYPFVPDCNTVPMRDTVGAFQAFRSNMTREMVQNRRHTDVYPGSCIGDGSNIHPTASVKYSVLGRNCQVHKGAVLLNAYLLDNVVVESGAVVEYSLLCSNSVIRTGATVERGCVLSAGSVVAAGHTVPAFTRVSLHKQSVIAVDTSDDELEYSAGGDAADAGYGDPDYQHSAPQAAPSASGQEPYDQDAVGGAGRGYRWQIEPDGEVQHRDTIALPVLTIDSLYEELSTERQPSAIAAGAALTVAGGTEEEGDSDEAEDDAVGTISHDTFNREVQETLLRGLVEDISTDNLALEINSLKLAEVREFSHCSEAILRCLLDLCSPAVSSIKAQYKSLFPAAKSDVATPTGKAELAQRFKTHLGKFTEVLQRFIKDEDDEINILLAFEEYCTESATRDKGLKSIVTTVFSALYDKELVSEKAFESWAAEKQLADASEREFLQLAQPFLKWLTEAEEESDEESDDDSEEASDDEESD